MIALTPPDWSRFRHAYGEASDIPDLLGRLGADPRPAASTDDDPWFTLWSSLCHQGDVYSASYAAVPHLVRIALAAEGPIDGGFFHLPACIEVARLRGRGPALAADQDEPYRAALQDLVAHAFRTPAPWDGGMAQSVLALVAASKGQTDLAEALIVLDDDLIARVLEMDF